MLVSIIPAISLLVLLVALVLPANATDFVLTPELLHLTHTAVELSKLAFATDPVSEAGGAYDSIQFWNAEPDQAILVSVNGYCIAAFRGTEITNWSDVYQDVPTGTSQLCAINAKDNQYECCDVVQGFDNAYNAVYRAELEQALRNCAASCSTNVDGTPVCPTVVLTGQSQGASVAAIGALYLTDLHPIVWTFGTPRAIAAPCNLVDSANVYRFENSRAGNNGLTYDPVPYVPYEAQHWGHQIMLGEDASGVAYIGLDSEIDFTPWDFANAFATHRLDSAFVGYRYRIQSIVDENTYTGTPNVRTSGFQNGYVCSQSVECDSKNCVNQVCTSW